MKPSAPITNSNFETSRRLLSNLGILNLRIWPSLLLLQPPLKRTRRHPEDRQDPSQSRVQLHPDKENLELKCINPEKDGLAKVIQTLDQSNPRDCFEIGLSYITKQRGKKFMVDITFYDGK